MKKDRHQPIQITIKKNGHAAAHGGAWKVALADFMTAMFCLFLVLWLTNQSTDIKSAIAGYFADPLGRASEHGSSILPGDGAQAALVQPQPPSQEDILNMRRDRLMVTARRIEKKLETDPLLQSLRHQIEIRLTEDGLRIELLEDSTGSFYDRAEPAPNARGAHILALLGAELGKLPLPVRIEGHTDAYPFKSDRAYTNWELSADRANAARRIMTMSGLAAIQVAQVTAYADRDPRVPGNRYDPANRRVTITMLLRDPREAGDVSVAMPPRPADPE